MEVNRVIVIGASAGGVEALRELFQGLKPGLHAAIFVVLHLPPDARSYLPQILNREGQLSVKQAQDNELIEAGRAYIAPPNQHLIIQNGRIRLTFGPKINHTRPAIDPLFETAARNYGPRAVGIILSGSLHDGTKGMLLVKQAGGVTVVQNPDEALFSGMLESVLQVMKVDYSLPVERIASLLNKLANVPVPEKGETQVSQPMPDSSEEANFIKQDMKAYERGYESDQRSILTCPECGGVLWEIKDGQLLRYRCHTGHIYNVENLLASYDQDLEKIFWTAIRTLIEKAAVANRLAVSARARQDQAQEAFYLAVAKEAEQQNELIRKTWLQGPAEGSVEKSAGEQATGEFTQSQE